MTFLSEDPTYLAGFLILVAGGFLMALKVTQQGKYLAWALTALGLAVAVVVIERLWVTDNVGTANSTWSLGFQETEPGVWKVNRITPVSMTEGAVLIPRSPSSSRTGGRGQGDVNQRVPGSVGPGIRPRSRSNGVRSHGRPSVPTPVQDKSGEELRRRWLSNATIIVDAAITGRAAGS